MFAKQDREQDRENSIKDAGRRRDGSFVLPRQSRLLRAHPKNKAGCIIFSSVIQPVCDIQCVSISDIISDIYGVTYRMNAAH